MTKRVARLGAVLGGAAVAWLVRAQAALAQTPTPTATATPGTLGEGARPVEGASGFGGWDWAGLGLRLGLVLLVIWGAVIAMRWYGRRMQGVGGAGAGRQLQILETRALGPNRSLQLVRLGGRAVLVGVTPERINSLMAIDDAAEVERLVTAIEGDARSRPLYGVASGLRSVPAGALGRVFKTLTPRPPLPAWRGEGEGGDASVEHLGSYAADVGDDYAPSALTPGPQSLAAASGGGATEWERGGSRSELVAQDAALTMSGADAPRDEARVASQSVVGFVAGIVGRRVRAGREAREQRAVQRASRVEARAQRIAAARKARIANERASRLAAVQRALADARGEEAS